MNFSFKSLFAIWSLSPQRFRYYFYLSIVSWQYQQEKCSTILILVLCLLCVTPLVCSSYSSFAPSSSFFSWWQKDCELFTHTLVLQCSPSTSSRQPLYLLIVGFNYCVMRFAYALHMRQQNLVLFPCLYIELSSFELVIDAILHYCTTPPCHKINLFKRPFRGSNFERLDDAFVLLVSLIFVYPQKILICVSWLFGPECVESCYGQRLLLTLCAASRMWVTHRSVVIVPPEGGLDSWWDSRQRLCFIHVTVSIVLGFQSDLQDIKSNHKTHTFLPPHNTHFCFDVVSSRIETAWGRRKTAECTSRETPWVFLAFSKQPMSRWFPNLILWIDFLFPNYSCSSKQLYVDHAHVVSPSGFLSNPCTSSTLNKESFVYFVCTTEIPQLSFTWKLGYILSCSVQTIVTDVFMSRVCNLNFRVLSVRRST